MQLIIDLEEGIAAIHYYYKHIKGYDINDNVTINMPKKIKAEDIKFILNTKENQEFELYDNKKIYWDEKCPKCNKNSLMIIRNNNMIVQKCLSCGFEDKDILEEESTC